MCHSTYVLCGGKVEQEHSCRTRASETRYVPLLPLDVFEMVIREACLALTYMRDASWRRSLLLIAWKHVVCRTIPELRFYLRLRYGSLLGDEIRSQPHLSLLVVTGFMSTQQQLCKHAILNCQPPRIGLVRDLDFWKIPPTQRVIYPALSINIRPCSPYLPARSFGAKWGQWLWDSDVHSHQPRPIDITLWNVAEMEAGLQETSYKFPSVTSLVVHGSFFGRNGNMAVCFPALKVLTLMGAAQTILPLLPLLPESLQHLTLDTLAGVPGAPHGTVHLWRLIPAFRQGFRIGAAGKVLPAITLVGGVEEPTGWQEAARLADEQGITLNRRVDGRSEGH
jgi:hypothetical protein